MSVRNVWFFYSMPSTIKKHIKSTHYKCEKGFKCTACPFATSNLDSFRYHKQRVHGERKKTCVCEKCGYITYTRGGVKRHQESCLSMEEGKKYKCNTCPHEFLDMKQLKKHVKVEHDKVVLPVKTLCSLLRPLCATIVTIPGRPHWNCTRSLSIKKDWPCHRTPWKITSLSDNVIEEEEKDNVEDIVEAQLQNPLDSKSTIDWENSKFNCKQRPFQTF